MEKLRKYYRKVESEEDSVRSEFAVDDSSDASSKKWVKYPMKFQTLYKAKRKPLPRRKVSEAVEESKAEEG